jgi:hypothetical protein
MNSFRKLPKVSRLPIPMPARMIASPSGGRFAVWARDLMFENT